MVIYEALKSDHTKVKQLLTQLTGLAKDAEKHDLIEQIRDALIPHARAEEAVFYNALRSIEGAKDLVRHGYREHMEAETLLRTLQVRDKIDAEWKETAWKLKEAVEHHINEEETRIFTAARQYISEQEAGQLGEAFEKLKPEILNEGIMGTTMDLVVNLMPPRFTSSFRKHSGSARI